MASLHCVVQDSFNSDEIVVRLKELNRAFNTKRIDGTTILIEVDNIVVRIAQEALSKDRSRSELALGKVVHIISALTGVPFEGARAADKVFKEIITGSLEEELKVPFETGLRLVDRLFIDHLSQRVLDSQFYLTLSEDEGSLFIKENYSHAAMMIDAVHISDLPKHAEPLSDPSLIRAPPLDLLQAAFDADPSLGISFVNLVKDLHWNKDASYDEKVRRVLEIFDEAFIYYANPLLEKIVGFITGRSQALSGIKLSNIHHACLTSEIFKEICIRFFDANSLQHVITIQNSESHEIMYIKIALSLMNRKSLSTAVAFCVLTDVTAEKKKENGLLIYKSGFQQATQGMLLLGESGCICEANPAFLELLGYLAPEELQGVSISELCCSDGLKATTIMSAGKTLGEGRFKKKDGSLIVLSFRASVLRNQDGVSLGVICSTQDMTSAHEALEARVLKELAERSNAQKSRFIATMSHEIRTPIVGVVGALELLKKTDLQADQRELIRMGQISIQTLTESIENILSFARIEAGKMNLEVKPFSFKSTLSDLKDVFVGFADKKGLRFEFQVDPSIDDQFLGDSVKLRRILANLISNALKYTLEGGSVIVRATLERQSEDDATIKFEVNDTGLGVDKNQFERLFIPFERIAEVSAKSAEGGTGLGLPIAMQLAELMGAKIEVESRVGIGSTFYFTVVLQRPKLTKAISADQIECLTPDQKKSVRILLVEDNPTNGTIVRMLLMKEGYGTVDWVKKGEDAFEAVKKKNLDNRYHVIFMDLQMPEAELDGFKATKVIREWEVAHPEIGSTPIIALTASVVDETKDECARIGMNGFICKPCTLDALNLSILNNVKRSLKKTGSPSLAGKP